MDFQELIQRLGVATEQTSLLHNPQLNPEIVGVAALEQSQAGMLTFVENALAARWSGHTEASALILNQNSPLRAAVEERQIAWILADDPRLLFAQTLALFYQPWQPAPFIHPTAAIHPSVQLGDEVSIGAHVTIEAGVVLGNGVRLHPGAVVYPEVSVGDRTVLYANSVIHERAVIGRDCVIHCGAVIGSEGFGFVPTATGWYKMQQSGRTVLEDEVEVGCNSTVDRPAVGETRIGRGTKIDNQVQVGHGSRIGQHCILVSQVGLAGAVEMGDRVVIAGQAGVADKVKLGAGAIVSAKSGVFQDVEAGETVSGFPAVPSKLWLRTSLLIRRLPDLFRSVAKLDKDSV